VHEKQRVSAQYEQVVILKKKMVSGRALHFVFKVADRALTAKFYREILGMKVTTFTNN
jgi:catechol-2,3-dioxygenase